MDQHEVKVLWPFQPGFYTNGPTGRSLARSLLTSLYWRGPWIIGSCCLVVKSVLEMFFFPRWCEPRICLGNPGYQNKDVTLWSSIGMLQAIGKLFVEAFSGYRQWQIVWCYKLWVLWDISFIFLMHVWFVGSLSQICFGWSKRTFVSWTCYIACSIFIDKHWTWKWEHVHSGILPMLQGACQLAIHTHNVMISWCTDLAGSKRPHDQLILRIKRSAFAVFIHNEMVSNFYVD